MEPMPMPMPMPMPVGFIGIPGGGGPCMDPGGGGGGMGSVNVESSIRPRLISSNVAGLGRGGGASLPSESTGVPLGPAATAQERTEAYCCNEAAKDAAWLGAKPGP